MVKLKRSSTKDLFLESKQDEEKLRSYLGDDLFEKYMDVRKKLPDLKNQFKDFTKVSFNTGRVSKEDNIQLKKDLVNSYNRLIEYLPRDKQSLFKKRNITNYDRLGGKTLETLLDKYKEARDIVFKDQARFRDFGQLVKAPVDVIQNWVDTFSTNRDKRQQDKVEGADKLYEDSDWVVYRITTYPAAQLYGSNTKWCISGKYPGREGRGQELFNEYIEEKDLDGGYYFYLSKKNPNEKYCVLQRKDKTIQSVWDASDTERGSSYDELGIELPEVEGVNLPKYGINDLLSSLKKGDIDKVKEYIRNGVNLNGKDSYGNTPLYEASKHKDRKDIVELLLSKGANPNIKNDNGNTPLHVTLNKDVVELLLKHGADINALNKKGATPLCFVAHNLLFFNECKGIIETLLKHGADPNIQDINGDTPLTLSFMNNNFDIVNLLLEYGANPNVKAKDREGRTEDLIYFSVYYDVPKDILESLLKHGANPNIKTKNGDSPLARATYYRDKDKVELLKKYGAME